MNASRDQDAGERKAPPCISLAIPVYNETSVIPELLKRTRQALDSVAGGPHEIVFVDDGSSDGTRELLEAAATEDPRITVVVLSRNFGHQAALSAALDFASGDVVIVMDGDLQDPPEAIPRFLDEYANGSDVVYAIRVERKESLLLRICYSLFYRIIAALSDISLPIGAGDFSLLSRRVVDVLRSTPERHRYLRGLRTWAGFRQTGVEIERSRRHSGRSKYGLRSLFGLAFDGIFAFSVIPLRMATLMGVTAIGCSLLYAVYTLYVKFSLNQPPPGFTTLILAMLFFSGVQLLFLGIIGEYVGRIYKEVKQRPLYVVKETVRHG